MAERRPVKEIFGDALELPERDRHSFLDRECGGDAALRALVEDLLKAHAVGTGFFANPTHSAAETMPGPVETPGSVIDGYKLLQLIGEGGFGAVYLAEERGPVTRKVALKIIKLGMDTRQVIARFEAERQALAMMDHPNIAKVLGAGATATGRPYFVMELVAGDPITAYCDRNGLSIDERLQLFAQVCHAVQHAHTKGIIHRDLKPSNVLVSTQDGKPFAKVIDFGIAKATSAGARLTEKTLFTEHRALIGTPEYMSPEQAEGSLDIDTRCDIYSLGVLLYELLTGAAPFDGRRLRSAAWEEMLRIIREEDPPKPSTRLSTLESLPSVAAQRHIEPARLTRLIRGDLDWIVMKCLEKNRARRYETANGLALDIERHLLHEAVEAGPPSRMYRIRKFIRRHRVGTAATATVILTLLLGLGGTSWGILWALDERDRAGEEAQRAENEADRAEEEADRADRAATEARSQRDTAEEVTKLMEEMLEGVFPSIALGRDTTLLLDMMERAVRRIESDELTQSPAAEVRLRLLIGGLYRDLGDYGASEAMLRPAEAMARKVYGGVHPVTGWTLRQLSSALLRNSQPIEALEKARESLAIFDQLYDYDHIDRAKSSRFLGECLLGQRRATDAMSMYLEAASMYERLSLTGTHEYANARAGRANCLMLLGRSAEALAEHQAALAILRQQHPGDHPLVADELRLTGYCLINIDKDSEALSRLEEALAMQRRLYTGDHPLIADNLRLVAESLLGLGQFDRAYQFASEARQMAERLFPSDHQSKAFTLVTEAQCMVVLNRQIEALAQAEAARGILQRIHPDDHPDVASALASTGDIFLRLGRPQEAHTYLQQALEMLDRLGQRSGGTRLFVLRGLGAALFLTGRQDKAVPILEEALSLGDLLGDNGEIERINLGFALIAVDRLTDAEACFNEAVRRSREYHPNGHPNIVFGLNGLARARQCSGDRAGRIEVLREAQALCGRLFPQQHPTTAVILHNLAHALFEVGDLDEAEALAREAVNMYASNLGWDLQEATAASRTWVRILSIRGRGSDAVEPLREFFSRVAPTRPPSDNALLVLQAVLAQALLAERSIDTLREAESYVRDSLGRRDSAVPMNHRSRWMVEELKSLLAEIVFTAAVLEGDTVDQATRHERFEEAESLALGIWNDALPPADDRGRAREARACIVALYEAWNTLEPGVGYDAKAAEWRLRLEALDADGGN